MSDDGRQMTRKLIVWGLDFSPKAINLLRGDERFREAEADGRAKASLWDITKNDPREIPPSLVGQSDLSLLLFCLSAISPACMRRSVKNVAATLKAGGILILRDYGRYDEAQMRLGTSRNTRLGENYYVKKDGTRCYYFELGELRDLFGPKGANLTVLELRYIRRSYKNRAQQVSRRRVWVQGRFRKSAL